MARRAYPRLEASRMSRPEPGGADESTSVEAADPTDRPRSVASAAPAGASVTLVDPDPHPDDDPAPRPTTSSIAQRIELPPRDWTLADSRREGARGAGTPVGATAQRVALVPDGATATERASFGSLLADWPVPNTRTRDANVAGTFSTVSPAATRC